MIERMIWILFPILWGKVSPNPQNCNEVSRSGYKFPFQQTKTILYHVPYHQVTSASTKQPTIALQDPNFPLLHQALPSNILPEQFHHVPTLNNINQQFLASQEETKQRVPSFSPNYFLPSPSTPQHLYVPSQNTFQTIKAETVHRPILNPYPVYPVVPLQPRPHGRILSQPTQPVPNNFQIYSPQVKATPLVYNQVYHPIFPTSGNLKVPQPNVPRYYSGFQPVPAVPVRASIQVHGNTRPKEEEREDEREDEREEQKEEVNENEEEEDDHDSIEEPKTDVPGYKRDYDFNENFYKNSKYSFPRFTVDDLRQEKDDEEEKGSYKVRDHEEQEDSEDDEGESIKNFVFAQPYANFPQRQPSNPLNFSFNRKPEKVQSKPKVPKTEVKMVRYSKTLHKPPREYIESKGSESIPVIHKTQQSFQENWYITKSTRT